MITNEILSQPLRKGKEVFIADTSRLIGNIELGNEVSIWFGAVIRADGDRVTIGDRSNVQDNAVVHVDPGFPTSIGPECIIGHGAVVHGATLANNVLVGIHATVLNGAVVGEFCIIGAGALIPEGMVVPAYSVVMGVPGKVVKTLSGEQVEKVRKNAQTYVDLGKVYLKALSA